MAKDYGIKVSQPGFDVLSATPQQMIFGTHLKSFKVYSVQTLNLTLTAGGSFRFISGSMSHGFPGGTPAYLPFLSYGGIVYPVQSNVTVNGIFIQTDTFIDASNITATVFANTAIPTPFVITFKFFIFTDKLA